MIGSRARWGALGKLLGLQAERVALPDPGAVAQRGGAVEEVARVELHTWLVGEDADRAPAGGLLDVRGVREGRSARTVEDEGVVVAPGARQLGMAVPEPLTDAGEGPQVERRPGHRRQSPAGRAAVELVHTGARSCTPRGVCTGVRRCARASPWSRELLSRGGRAVHDRRLRDMSFMGERHVTQTSITSSADAEPQHDPRSRRSPAAWRPW